MVKGALGSWVGHWPCLNKVYAWRYYVCINIVSFIGIMRGYKNNITVGNADFCTGIVWWTKL